MNGEIYGVNFSALVQVEKSPDTPPTNSKGKPDNQNVIDKQLSPIASRLVLSQSRGTAVTLTGQQKGCKLDFEYIAQRLKLEIIRPLQREALRIIMESSPVDTKVIQAPTSIGKDLLPFALAVATNKAQLMFVPFVALIENTLNEGAKLGCKVIKFSEIGKTIDIATAASTADVIICSYEHAAKAIRVTQELLSRQRLGWCFFNEAHVIIIDGEYRDFKTLHEICLHCPHVCCMTATLQHQHVAALASKLGRTGFSESMFLSPMRSRLAMIMKVTSDAKLWIVQQLIAQPAEQRAIVFCLFKKHVPTTAAFLKSHLGERNIFECTSGATADIPAFRKSESAVMVCTSVLGAGVSIDNITRVFFLDGSHGPESFLQGAGRGARAEDDQCVAALVASKATLEYYQQANMSGISEMATFCLGCIDNKTDFAEELCKVFEHPQHSHVKKRQRQDQAIAAFLFLFLSLNCSLLSSL
jgi:superfamily II DNA helicase RecQ